MTSPLTFFVVFISREPLQIELPYEEYFHFEFPYNFRNLSRVFLEAVLAAPPPFYTRDKGRIGISLTLSAKAHGQINQRRKERAPVPSGSRYFDPTDPNLVEKRGLPYVVHPIETAYNGFRRGESPSVVVAELLHDTREDTHLQRRNRKYIEKVFGGLVVEGLTHIVSKYEWREQEDGSVVCRKMENNEYAEKLSHSHEAIRMKHDDISANMRSDGRRLTFACQHPPEDWEVFFADLEEAINKVETYYLPLEDSFYAELADETGLLLRRHKERIMLVRKTLGLPISEKKVFTLPSTSVAPIVYKGRLGSIFSDKPRAKISL